MIDNCVNNFEELDHRIEIPRIPGIQEKYAFGKFKYLCGNIEPCSNKIEYESRNYCKFEGEWIG